MRNSQTWEVLKTEKKKLPFCKVNLYSWRKSPRGRMSVFQEEKNNKVTGEGTDFHLSEEPYLRLPHVCTWSPSLPHSPFFLQLKHLAVHAKPPPWVTHYLVSPMNTWHIHVSKAYLFSFVNLPFVIGVPAKDLEGERENYCFLPYDISIRRRLPFRCQTGFPNDLLPWDKAVQGQDRCPHHA